MFVWEILHWWPGVLRSCYQHVTLITGYVWIFILIHLHFTCTYINTILFHLKIDILHWLFLTCLKRLSKQHVSKAFIVCYFIVIYLSALCGYLFLLLIYFYLFFAKHNMHCWFLFYFLKWKFFEIFSDHAEWSIVFAKFTNWRILCKRFLIRAWFSHFFRQRISDLFTWLSILFYLKKMKWSLVFIYISFCVDFVWKYFRGCNASGID